MVDLGVFKIQYNSLLERVAERAGSINKIIIDETNKPVEPEIPPTGGEVSASGTTTITEEKIIESIKWYCRSI